MIRNRRLRAVLCILLLAVVLAASVTWAAHLLDHHCTGEDCPVCARLIRAGGVRGRSPLRGRRCPWGYGF